MKTVAATVRLGLCCSCGVCKGVCPRNCIDFVRKDGMFLPAIEETACVNCGLCASVCPGLGHTYAPKATAEETVTGEVLACFNAWSRDPELRHVSASGGVVSTIVRQLLKNGSYDGAFCLDNYDYRQQLKTRLYTPEEVAASWARSSAPKSRYLPVSHENAVRYMLKNREKRLILVGTSCGIRSLQAAVEARKLNREQYLFIGLFCDKVFNYNVLSYFEDAYGGGTKLKALHFKNKESGGWPGDMKFFPADGAPFYVPMSARTGAKAYFMPERCLYCVDKLNVCADISLGDNYTGKDESPLGSNSVIIRTEAGRTAWQAAADGLEIRPIGIADIQEAQAIGIRLQNLYFGDLASEKWEKPMDLNPGVPRAQTAASCSNACRVSLKRLRTGAVYHRNPAAVGWQIRRDNRKPNLLVRGLRKLHRLMR